MYIIYRVILDKIFWALSWTVFGATSYDAAAIVYVFRYVILCILLL